MLPLAQKALLEQQEPDGLRQLSFVVCLSKTGAYAPVFFISLSVFIHAAESAHIHAGFHGLGLMRTYACDLNPV